MRAAGRRRVGVNLLWLVPGDVGGTEEYAVRLLGALGDARPAGLDLTLFGLPSLAAAHPDLVDRFPTVTAPVDGRRRGVRVAAETSWLAAQVRRRRLDLVHHLGGAVPALRGAPAMVTIHDLQPLLRPAHFTPVQRVWFRAVLPWSVRAARVVVAVSDFTAATITEHLGVAPGRLRVVPHGVHPASPVDPAEVDRVRAVYGLGDRWFAFPAVTWAHKNHVLLVRAFGRVAATNPTVSLVLTGGAGPAEAAVLAEIRARGLDGRVRRTGRIPRADLDALLGAAVALTFPSSFEGFGAPVLEAMAVGCPVVAARAAALPEVVGDAGILLSPENPDEWAAAMTDLLTSPDRRHRLADAGRARAATMGWDRSAGALVEAWRAALSAGLRR